MAYETRGTLCAEIEKYCQKHGLWWESADEMAMEQAELIVTLREVADLAIANLRKAQSHYAYLTDFCERWEAVETRESIAHQLQDAGYGLEVCGGGALYWTRTSGDLYLMLGAPHGEEVTDEHGAAVVEIYGADGDIITHIDGRNLRDAIKKAAAIAPVCAA